MGNIKELLLQASFSISFGKMAVQTAEDEAWNLPGQLKQGIMRPSLEQGLSGCHASLGAVKFQSRGRMRPREVCQS